MNVLALLVDSGCAHHHRMALAVAQSSVVVFCPLHNIFWVIVFEVEHF